ncbi:MAG: hypothetical protein FWD40_08030 [Treponema sp.]|nr:hypothetical protein [Treponema sp.]
MPKNNDACRYKILVAVFLIFSVFIFPAYSEEDDTAANTIRSIEIQGLSKTRPHIASYPLEKFLGQDALTFDLNEVYAAVIDMGILEPLSAELIETADGFILHLIVEEKWSLFPFPLVYAGSDDINLGLFFCDLNAFGLRDMAVIGGAYSTRGWHFISLYNHTPNRRGVPGLNGMFMYSRNEKENVDRHERVNRKFTQDRILCSLGLNYIFLDLITGSMNFNFINISLNDDDVYNPPENGAMLIGFNPGLSLRNSSWDGYFLSSRNISLQYTYNLAVSGSSFHQVEYKGGYEQSLVPGFRINVRSAGVWKSTDDPLYEEGPHKALVNILPRDYSALYMIGLSAGLEKYILKLNWGTFSVQFSWQGVYSYNTFTDLEFDHGPSAGMLFYLSRLAIPAIGINTAYNVVSGLYQFSFSVGMSF